TTAINLGELFCDELRDSLGEPGYTMSTTPQVALDCQVTVRGGGLFVNWDVVDELFCDGVVDAMFGGFRDLLERLACGDWWAPAARTCRWGWTSRSCAGAASSPRPGWPAC